MSKTFKSKVDFLFLLFSLVLLLAEVYMIFNGLIIGVVALAIPILFLIYMYFTTLYTVTNNQMLQIKSGVFFHRDIYIKSIKKVRPVRHRRPSPALSPNRLEISYNRYGRVFVSPTHMSEFIKDLKDVNPRIKVEENN